MSAVGTIVSAGYGFICGAYMPISNFGKGLQKGLSYVPSTYGTSMLKNHMLRGVFEEMKSKGFPDDVVTGIADSLGCNPVFRGHVVSSAQIYHAIMGVNINLGKNKKLLEQCQTLKEYAIYVKKVRTYAKSMKVEEAVDRAVTECINEGILREFLLQNRKEAVEMSIFEYDEEAVFEVVRKDEYEKGIQEGEKQFALLTERLLEAGRTQDLLRATQDQEYRKLLYKEYQIS